MNKLKFVLGVAFLATWIWIGVCAQARAQFNGDGGFMVQQQSFAAVPKVSLYPEDAGNPINYMRSQDYNQLYSAVYDTRSWLNLPRPLQAFGALCNGVADDSVALILATATPGVTTVTDGNCAINTSLVTIPPGVELRFEDTGSLQISAGQVLTVNGTVSAPLRRIFNYSMTDKAPVQFGAWNNTGYLPGTIEDQRTVYPQWFGTYHDGGGDDSPGIQAAINSLGWSDGGPIVPGGGKVLITSGFWRLNEPLVFSVNSTGVTFEGVGWVSGFNGSYLNCETPGTPCIQIGDLFGGTGVGPANVRLGNLALDSNVDAGSIIAFGESSFIHVHDVTMRQLNPNARMVDLTANSTILNQIDYVDFKNIVMSLNEKYAAPAIYIEANTGQDVSEVRFDEVLINGIGDSPTHDGGEGIAPQIEMHENGITVDCADIEFRKIRMEEPAGGAIYNYGCRNVSVTHSLDADLQYPMKVPLILLAEGGDGGVPFLNSLPNNMKFEEDQFFDGTNANPCIKLPFCASGFAPPIIENSYCYGPIETGICAEPTLFNSSFPLSDAGGAFVDLACQGVGICGIKGVSSTQVPTFDMGQPACTLPAGQTTVVCNNLIPQEDDQYKVLLTEVATSTDAGFEALNYRTLVQKGDAGTGDGNSRSFIIQASGTPTYQHVFNWFPYR